SRRGAPVRARLPPAAARIARLRVDLRRPRGRRPGAQARTPPAFRFGRGDARRNAGGARGRARRPAEDRAPDLCAAAQDRRRVALLEVPAASVAAEVTAAAAPAAEVAAASEVGRAAGSARVAETPAEAPAGPA